MKNARSLLRTFALGLILIAAMPALAQVAGVRFNPKLEDKVKPFFDGRVPTVPGGLGIVEDDAGSWSAFRIGHAVLKLPPGVDLQAHAAEAGLKVVRTPDLSPAKYSYGEKPSARTEKLKQRNRVSLVRADHTSVLVALPVGRTNPSAFLQRLSSKGLRSKLRTISSESALRTFAAVDDYRAKYEARGFRMVVDVLLLPQQLLNSTSEAATAYCLGGVCRDAMSDPFWAITELRRAWHLAQVANTPFADPEQGFSDNVANTWIGTVRGPPILGIVDSGFAASAADHRPDIIFTWGTPIGGAGASNFHGTKVSSTAASPVNDGAGTAGSSVYARGSSVSRLDSRADMGLLWAEPDDLSHWTVGHTVIAAVGGGADVVNLSLGADCDWWCRNFGSISGWNAMSDALEFAAENGAVVIAAAGNGSSNGCGNDIQDLKDIYFIPCEMASNGPVCVGAIDRSSQNACNFGNGVDVWAPGRNVWTTATPGNAISQVTGTSFASPFVAGVVAMAIAASGRHLSTSEVRTALRETSTASSDSRAPRILNAYGFLRRFATVRPDAFEYNNSAEYSPTVTQQDLLSTKASLSSSFADDDWFDLPATALSCSTVTFDVRFINDPATGEPQARLEHGPWVTGAPVGLDLRRFTFPTVRDWNWPINQRLLALRTQGSLPTGYSFENIQYQANPYPGGEGPAYPDTCNGRDDDCDGQVDEGFPNTDGDGMADCVDPDDDNDCVLDETDNCPLVANAHQFCPQANNPDRFPLTGKKGCGDRTCANRVYSKDDVGGIGGSIGACFKEFPPEPNCFKDGCPFPGPMIHPGIANVVTGALKLHADIAGDPKRHAAVLPEFGVLRGFRSMPNGDLIIGEDLRPGAGAPPVPAPGSMKPDDRIRAIAASPLCKPVFAFEPKLKNVFDQAVACWDNVRAKPCQVDSVGDGRGDACRGMVQASQLRVAAASPYPAAIPGFLQRKLPACRAAGARSTITGGTK